MVGAIPITFEIDTGADVNIVAEETFSTLVPVMTLKPANITLDSPGSKLACLGQFQAIGVYKEKLYPFSAYVIHGHKVNNLLSRSLSAEINFVKRGDEAIKEDYYGALEHYNAYGEHSSLKTDPVKIYLKESAQPHAEHTARLVPIPMLHKVKEELHKMENNCVIEHVT